MARDLQAQLGYASWVNFQTVIERAEKSCKDSGYKASDHFRGVTKMVRVGKGGKREIDVFILTRYACYLIALGWQVLLIKQQLDGFDGKLTSSNWAVIAKCSPDTALFRQSARSSP